MSPLAAIIRREFAAYYRTSTGYVFLAVYVALSVSVTFFLGDFFDRNEASMQLFFSYQPWIRLIFLPAVAMRLWAEERHAGTWELLLTLPVGTAKAVVGKFLGAWLFALLGLALTVLFPATLAFLGDPDWGPILAGYLGCGLMAGGMLGPACLASALSRSQIVAFVLAVAANFVILLLGWDAFSRILDEFLATGMADAIESFSYSTHFSPFTSGLIALHHVLFFVSVAAFCLIMNILVIRRQTA